MSHPAHLLRLTTTQTTDLHKTERKNHVESIRFNYIIKGPSASDGIK